jgi:hypothetical protein
MGVAGARIGVAVGFLWLALGCAEAKKSEGRPADAAVDAAGGPDAGGDGFVPRCRRSNPQREAFFGDLHVHTALSLDANLQGTRLRPVEAYRFARGEPVGLPPYDADSKPLRMLSLERPLDFVALSDHAEFLGLVTTCLSPELEGYDSAECTRYRGDPDGSFVTLNAQLGKAQGSADHITPCTADNAFCGSAALSAWNEVKASAAQANDDSADCTFTAFVAYEWSASPGTKNLHRNVIFANDVVPALPFSYFDGNQEEDLWDALDRDCLKRAGGCDALTIPHNSNVSAGLMFETVDGQGRLFDAEYAARRAAFEPLVEIFQHKGSSECLPSMGPDELCGFEIMPYNLLSTTALGGAPNEQVPSDYVRDALGVGLALEQKLGKNPFAYGFVASTDTHLGIAGAVDESSFPGHGGAGSNARDSLPPGLVDKAWLNPGGLAVLWAEENSREALFLAMRRKEAYGTSGPRIVLRFFGGSDLPDDLCGRSDFVERGYADGVPMGGRLAIASSSKKPRFAVWALRDAGTAAHPGGQLERVQIIKGYLDAGKVRYSIHDVAGGASAADVDPATCTPRGEGHDELCAVWSDDEFDASQPAFYYARVLENPSCRWHRRACLAGGVDCARPETVTEGFEGCCDDFPDTVQERAWSSPIFHRPE